MNPITGILLLMLLPACQKPIEGDLIITNASIIDVETGEVRPAQDVVIVGESITRIHDARSREDYRAGEFVDGTGKFLIPGLWDMHTHTLVDYRYRHNIPIQMAYGITGFRDMGGSVQLRDSIQDLDRFASLPVPHMKVAGYILGGDPGRNGAKTATMEEARAYVDILAKSGVDHIKTYYYLHPEVYLAVADQAAKHGLTIQGHVPLAFGMQRASELGQRSIEHMSAVPYWCTANPGEISRTMMNTWHEGREGPAYSGELLDHVMDQMDTLAINQLAETLRTNGTFLCPTMSTYEYLTHITHPEYSESPQLDLMNYIEAYYFRDDQEWSRETYMKDSVRGVRHLSIRKQLLKRLFDQGVSVIAGTDAGVAFHGIHLHKELQIYVELGMTPLQALQTATINPAKFLHMENQLGTVSPGKWADLVLLDRNPLENIAHTRSIAGVLARGKYASRQQIERVLDSIRVQHARQPIIDTVRAIMDEDGLEAALQLARHLWSTSPDTYQFHGQQFVLLAFEIWADDRLDEVKALLRAESEFNPHEPWFGILQLGALYREIDQQDSARMVYEQMLKYYGPGELRAQSHLRRLDQPDYGKQTVRVIPDSIRRHFSSSFFSDSNEEYDFSFHREQLVIQSPIHTDTMVYVGHGVFRSPDEYHNRLVIWEDNSLMRINFNQATRLRLTPPASD